MKPWITTPHRISPGLKFVSTFMMKYTQNAYGDDHHGAIEHWDQELNILVDGFKFAQRLDGQDLYGSGIVESVQRE